MNVGYYLFAAARGQGCASRAAELLLGFVQKGEVNGEPFVARDLG